MSAQRSSLPEIFPGPEFSRKRCNKKFSRRPSHWPSLAPNFSTNKILRPAFPLAPNYSAKKSSALVPYQAFTLTAKYLASVPARPYHQPPTTLRTLGLKSSLPEIPVSTGHPWEFSSWKVARQASLLTPKHFANRLTSSLPCLLIGLRLLGNQHRSKTIAATPRHAPQTTLRPRLSICNLSNHSVRKESVRPTNWILTWPHNRSKPLCDYSCREVRCQALSLPATQFGKKVQKVRCQAVQLAKTTLQQDRH